MKKILSALLLTSFLAMPLVVLGQEAPNVNVMDALNRITNWAFAILLAVAAMFMVFGAFTYITASGDAEKIKKAHDSIMYSLVGVAVAVLAKGLVALIQRIVAG